MFGRSLHYHCFAIVKGKAPYIHCIYLFIYFAFSLLFACFLLLTSRVKKKKTGQGMIIYRRYNVITCVKDILEH